MLMLRGGAFPLSALQWTSIILAAMTALTTIICAVISAWVAIQLRTPSGKTVGEMVERSEHLAAVNTMKLMQMNGDPLDHASQPPDDDVS